MRMTHDSRLGCRASPGYLQGEGMKTLRTWVCSARLLGPAFAACLLAGTFAPVSVAAHDDHEQGNVIANANGDNVLLRSGPSYQDSEITRYPEGTHVDIVDGPSTADDGSIWYQVSIDGQTGYMVSDFLAASGSESASEPASSEGGIVAGTAMTNDSVYLRSGPSTADAIVRSLPAGETLMLTGGSRDGWNSVSASGGDGWVFSDYLTFGSGATGVRFTIDTVHLRSGPGTGYSSMSYLAVGVELELSGEEQDGFVKVSSASGTGWVAAQYIGNSAPAQPEEPTAPETPAPEQPGETGRRYTIESVHLRAGPGISYDSITYFATGEQLELTGEEMDGFVQVTSEAGAGWVYAQYIGTTAPETPEEPAEPEQPTPEEPAAPAEPVARFATANVNLRSSSSAVSTVLDVIASGTEVEFTGLTENGFSEVRTAAGDGWISSEFLSDTRPEAPAGPEPSSSLLIWPVSGGEWVVSQGYNGSSHQNRSSSWQYYYSLDLKRSDGSTAGHPVYSAVSGTVRWIDESTGGMSIYMGNGLAYAYFHTRIDPGIQEGDTITQGQYMGTIAPAGEAGSGSSAHLHITVWESSDEGNWSRNAIPFSGATAIEGIEFPATGAGNDHRGYTFNP
jgi:uncharacterized protein YraI